MPMILASREEVERQRREADERRRLQLEKNRAIARRFWNKECPWLWLITHLPHDGQEVLKQRLSKPEELLEELEDGLGKCVEVFVRFVVGEDEWIEEVSDELGSKLIDYLARFYTQTTDEKWCITHLVVITTNNSWRDKTPKIRILVPPKNDRLGFRSLLTDEIIRQADYEGTLGPEQEEG